MKRLQDQENNLGDPDHWSQSADQGSAKDPGCPTHHHQW